MKSIPEPSRRRLVAIAQLLTQQTSEKITSVTIEKLTGWSQSLIRKDISLLELRSGASNGYKVAELKEAIFSAFNIKVIPNNQKKCCIVGLGRLGAALLENSIFDNSPFKIVAGFDSNVNRTEILRASFPLHPTTLLESVIKSEKIEFAILAVPEKNAIETAKRLANCGIKGIVNYTSSILTTDENITIENVSPITALTNLLASC
ncbi:MAG: Gfo/Idh/MocA family oxidoreductase [Treponema sp.]|nr:Gfo/Idh/MocA family oxidoreductase [Treponema sp.]MBP3607449.1 Gfo/Idh/MocA family oxidoreductase [Treponema sp.]